MDSLRQDPENLRNRGSAHGGVVGSFLERAQNDPDYEASFHSNLGYAADAFLVKLGRRYLQARGAGWTSVADGHQYVDDTSQSAAGALESTDLEDGANVRRTAPEV
ncbi:hypothetical protein [Nocardia anaemiae]|uniref:hypothetical protein n=1 Tax=Nocardia anaemiae TaxID=263910 RepID=UPI0007A4B2B6|nr:hypothetical protein [Nocardia anaemiae]